MKIRKEQVEALEAAAARSFQDQMVEHLKDFAPRHAEAVGEQGLREVVRLGIERAGKYGLTNRGAVRLYIELMVTLGSDFDTDPQFPWAAEVLTDEKIIGQAARTSHLYERAMVYLDRAGGPDKAYAIDALRTDAGRRIEDLATPGGSVRGTVLAEMKRTHPQKCACVGAPALRRLIEEGIESAKRFGLSTDAGAAVFVLLMFALGHGFATDPQFPWAAEALGERDPADPDERAERLHDAARSYFRQALAGLEKR